MKDKKSTTRYRIVPTSGMFNKDYKIQAYRTGFPFWVRAWFGTTFTSKVNATFWLNEKLNPTYYPQQNQEEKI